MKQHQTESVTWTEYWVQQKVPWGWVDWTRKDSLEIARRRVPELDKEHPWTTFRCIIRQMTKIDQLPNNEATGGSEPSRAAKGSGAGTNSLLT